jgi:hypothetical protein
MAITCVALPAWVPRHGPKPPHERPSIAQAHIPWGNMHNVRRAGTASTAKNSRAEIPSPI